MKELIKEIEKKAKSYFENLEGVHDWTHVERVRKLALGIGKSEGADLQVIEIASLLHDIGRMGEKENMNSKCHAEISAQWSEKILDEYDIDKASKENIIHSIICHRYRNSHSPETLEAKCLYDADKLDSIGAIGIARNFLFAGHYTTTKLYTGNEKEIVRQGKEREYEYTKDDTGVLEYEARMKKIKNKMLTKTGKDLAKRRHEFMENFFEEFWAEVKGEF